MEDSDEDEVRTPPSRIILCKLNISPTPGATLQNVFEALDDEGPMKGPADNELQHYLDTPIEKPANPIQWWKDRRDMYPNLSRMAIDFLCIPGTYFSLLYHSSTSRTLSNATLLA